MQRFLSHFHQLTHLTLNIRGSATDLAMGNHWETCSSIIGLRDFQFHVKFCQTPLDLPSSTIQDIFDSFSTPFWCQVKKWHVIVTPTTVCTSSFLDDQLWIGPSYSPLSTFTNDQYPYEHIKQIEVDAETPLDILKRFQYLEQLVLVDDSLLLSFEYLHQFIHLRHLICHRTISNAAVGKVLSHTSHIDRLTLSNTDFNQLSPLHTIRCLSLLKGPPIKHRTQIRKLCRAFPSLKRLSMSIHCVDLMCPIVDHLEQLENAQFCLTEKPKPLTAEWFRENTRLGQHSITFTYRQEGNAVLLWIGHPVRCSIALRDW